MISRKMAARRAGRSLAVFASALALGACVPGDHRGQSGDPPSPPPTAPGASASPSGSTDPLAECPASGVRIRSTGSDAAMGLRALGLELVNCGDTPYQLNGYPALHVFDEQRDPIRCGGQGGQGDHLGLRPAAPAADSAPGNERATAGCSGATWSPTRQSSPPTAEPDGGARGRPTAQAVDPDGPVDLGNTGRIGVSAWKKADPSAPAPTRPAPPPIPSAEPSSVSPPTAAVSPARQLVMSLRVKRQNASAQKSVA